MTEFDKVMNMLNKNVELSSEVDLKSELIELDAVADIQALVKKTVDTFKEQDKARQAAKKALEDFRQNFVEISKAANSAQVQIDALEKQAKGLGLSLPDNIRNYYKLMQGYAKDANQGNALIQKMQGMI